MAVDSREPPSLVQKFLTLLPEESSRKAMLAGDYRIEHEGHVLLIERKAVGDLLTTWVTREPGPDGWHISRLRRQLQACQKEAEVTALLVEGSLSEDPATGFCIAGKMLRKIKYQSVMRLLLDLQGEGIKLLWTANNEQTVTLVCALHESLRRPLTWSNLDLSTTTPAHAGESAAA